MRRCIRYDNHYIANYNNQQKEEIAVPIVKKTAADYVAERKARKEIEKQKREAARTAVMNAKEASFAGQQAHSGVVSTAPGEPVFVSTPAKKHIVFKEDGHEHEYCPMCDVLDREVHGIVEDTLYCINTNTLPNEGNALDQSCIFRLAYSVLKTEQSIIKNEMEKDAIDKAKQESKTKNSSKGGRR